MKGENELLLSLIALSVQFFFKQLAPVVVSTAAAVPIVETTLGTAEFMPG